MEINTLFRKDSQELKDYLAKNPIGNTRTSSDGSKVWNISNVKIRTDLPEDPNMGKVVLVQLVLSSPDEILPPVPSTVLPASPPPQ